MTAVKSRKIMDEICDNISGDAKEWIRSIDRMEKKIESLELIEAQMRQEADEALFVLVTTLPEVGTGDHYYVKFNNFTGKYEEFSWNGSSYDKIGLIGDAVKPALDTATAYHPVDSSQEGYSNMDPSAEGWWEDVYTQDEALSSDIVVDAEKTYYEPDTVYERVLSTTTGYSEMNPKHLDWYETEDGGETYEPTTDQSPANGKQYYKEIAA